MNTENVDPNKQLSPFKKRLNKVIDTIGSIFSSQKPSTQVSERIPLTQVLENSHSIIHGNIEDVGNALKLFPLVYQMHCDINLQLLYNLVSTSYKPETSSIISPEDLERFERLLSPLKQHLIDHFQDMMKRFYIAEQLIAPQLENNTFALETNVDNITSDTDFEDSLTKYINERATNERVKSGQYTTIGIAKILGLLNDSSDKEVATLIAEFKEIFDNIKTGVLSQFRQDFYLRSKIHFKVGDGEKTPIDDIFKLAYEADTTPSYESVITALRKYGIPDDQIEILVNTVHQATFTSLGYYVSQMAIGCEEGVCSIKQDEDKIIVIELTEDKKIKKIHFSSTIKLLGITEADDPSITDFCSTDVELELPQSQGAKSSNESPFVMQSVPGTLETGKLKITYNSDTHSLIVPKTMLRITSQERTSPLPSPRQGSSPGLR